MLSDAQKEKSREQSARYRATNKEKVRETRAKYQAKNKTETLSRERRIKYFLQRARRRAKEKDVEFTLTHENINFPEVCPVLGIPLVFANDKYREDNSPSLDRIDFTKGYTPENTIVVSWRANRIRNDGTIEEHAKIVSFYGTLSTSN